MLLARRLYLYFIAGVSLIALSIGLTNLLDLVIDVVVGSELVEGDEDAIRQTLSIYAAVTVVALPIWLLHWWLAERGLRGANRESERTSTTRALYLTAVLGGSLFAGTVATTRLVQSIILWIIGANNRDGFDDVGRWIAPVIVAAGVWGCHALVRRRDMLGGLLTGGADWLPRLYVYVVAFTGIALASFAVGDLLALILESLTTDEDVLFASGAWDGFLASSVARALVGTTIWISHWTYSLNLVSASDWRGQHARASVLRRFYGYAIAFGAVVLTLVLVTRIGETLLTTILDASPTNAEPFTRRLLDPLVRAIPFVFAWVYHRRIVLAESAGTIEDERQATVRRIYVYAIALIGLALTSFGVSSLIAVSLDRIAAGDAILSSTGGDIWREEVAGLASLSMVGLATWLWHWSVAQGWRSKNPSVERAATVRRVYLLSAIAASIVASLVGLVIIIYRMLAEVLNVDVTEGLLDELSRPLGTLVVAIAVLLYNAILLRADLSGTEAPRVAIGTTIRLEMTGPPDVDPEAIVASIQSHLPKGFVVRAVSNSKQPDDVGVG